MHSYVRGSTVWWLRLTMLATGMLTGWTDWLSATTLTAIRSLCCAPNVLIPFSDLLLFLSIPPLSSIESNSTGLPFLYRRLEPYKTISRTKNFKNALQGSHKYGVLKSLRSHTDPSHCLSPIPSTFANVNTIAYNDQTHSNVDWKPFILLLKRTEDSYSCCRRRRLQVYT